jgi:hypothetical protein
MGSLVAYREETRKAYKILAGWTMETNHFRDTARQMEIVKINSIKIQSEVVRFGFIWLTTESNSKLCAEQELRISLPAELLSDCEAP